MIGDPKRAKLTERGLRDLVHAYAETLEPERRVLLDRYRLVDMARKVVGVGSVGTRSWMLLMLEDGEHPLFLQAKEAGPSVLEAFVGASAYDNSGQRVVVGQRLMQTVSDIFLGWVRVTGLDGVQRDFYLRQLRDWKGSAEVETMVPAGFRAYGQICGWTLARAHARSGDRVAIAAYLGGGSAFDQAIRVFAESYADQNERDHQALVEAGLELRSAKTELRHGEFEQMFAAGEVNISLRVGQMLMRERRVEEGYQDSSSYLGAWDTS